MEAGKAGVALDFVFTVLAGLIIGWFIDRYLGRQAWVSWRPAGGFILAFRADCSPHTQCRKFANRLPVRQGRDPLK